MPDHPESSRSRHSGSHRQRTPRHTETRPSVNDSERADIPRRMLMDNPFPVQQQEMEPDQFQNPPRPGLISYQTWDTETKSYRHVIESGSVSPSESGLPAFNFWDGAQVPASRAGKVERSAKPNGKRSSHRYPIQAVVQYSPTNSDTDQEDYFVIGHGMRTGTLGKKHYLYTLSPKGKYGPEVNDVDETNLKSPPPPRRNT